MSKLKYKAVTKFPQIIRRVNGEAVIQIHAVWLQSPLFQYTIFSINIFFFLTSRAYFRKLLELQKN